MWRYETEENDAFSTAQYKAYNDFEHFLRDNIQGKVENHFAALPPDERRLITAKILRLVRCAPAGTIETDTKRGISFTETAESEQFSLDKTPRTGEASSLKKLRVLILKDALEGPERAAYTAADQATAAAGEGEGVGPGYPNIITQVEVTSHIRNVSSIDYLLWFVMRFKVSAR